MGEKNYSVIIDSSRDNFLTLFGKDTLQDRYLLPGESFQDLFARVAVAGSDDQAHAQRIYDYISKLWFMPATPILSNLGTTRGLPISCFVNEVPDSLKGIRATWNENTSLASLGGGIGTDWSAVRSISEQVGINGKTSGIMPFIKVMDSLTLAISQGSLRRGSAATYLHISHPEIEEFIEMRRPTGGDPNRRSLNLHHGVIITDAFMQAVENNTEWGLKSPKTGKVIRTVSARGLWIRLLTARIETGEPYLLFIDAINRQLPKHQQILGMEVKTSNLCSEITLPTGLDYAGEHRSAVCCLSSLNLETYLQWRDNPRFVEDVLRFLDNVLQSFIDTAPDDMAKAKYSAMMERSVGLGVMGWHSFLQAQNIPFESVVAVSWNRKIFKELRQQADTVSRLLADERGACPDSEAAGTHERFSNKLAVAPTASISIICGGVSAGIEPEITNAFTQKTLSGSTPIRNIYLKAVLEKHGMDNEEIWRDIVGKKGSVQQLDFLTNHEKDVFKTAFELDQRWIVEHAAQRTPYICQSQSVNLFLPANVSKKELHDIHNMAWKKGLKSLYYCRSMSIQRAETVGDKVVVERTNSLNNVRNGEECLVCQ